MTTKTIETKTEFGAGVAADQSQPLLFESDDKPKDKDDDDKKENMEEDGDGGLDVSAVVKAISSGAISVADMDSILEAINAQGGDTEEEAPAEQPAAAPAPGVGMKAKEDGAMSAQFAELRGEVDGLRAAATARDEAQEAKNDVAGAMQLLSDRPLGALDDLETKLTTFRKESGGGDLFKSYVQAMAGTAPLPAGASLTANGGKAPEIALKYQKDGTEAVDDAARFCAEFDELKAHSGALRQTKERYVELSMQRLAAKAQEA